MKKKKLARDLLFNILVFTLITMSFVVLSIVLMSQKNIKESIVEKAKDILQVMHIETLHYLEHPRVELTEIHELIEKGMDNQEINQLFEYFSYIHHVNVLDDKGTIIDSFPYTDDLIGLDMSQNDAFLDLRYSNKDEILGKVILDSYVGKATIYLSQRINNGYLVGYLDLSRFQDLIEKINISDGQIGLVDEKGYYIGHTDFDLVEERAKDPYINDIRAGKLENNSTVLYQGIRSIIHYEYVAEADWYLLYYHSVDYLDQNTIEAILSNVILFLLIIPIFGLLLGRKLQKVNKYILSLNEATNRISSGEYDLEEKNFKYEEFENLYERVKTMSEKVEIREEEIMDLNRELESNYYTTIVLMAKAIDAKDSYTGNHSVRVRDYALMLAKELDLSSNEIREIRFGATLHDIGKISIKEEVLNKPGRLTNDEFDLIKMHPQVGYDIVEELPGMNLAKQVILHHHERYDGNGYPYGLKGNEIPLLARIVTIADSFDAMTSERPYRHGHLSKREAFEELRKHAGTQFDPDLVEIFIAKIKAGT